MSLSLGTTEFDYASQHRKATGKLLDLLKKYHDPASQQCAAPQVIEIKGEPDYETSIEIGILPVPEGRLTADGIKRVVCKHFDVSHNDMVSARRDIKITYPRMIAIYFIRQFTVLSLPAIGRKFGDRDHTTVINSIRRVEGWLEGDAKLARDVMYLKEVLLA